MNNITDSAISNYAIISSHGRNKYYNEFNVIQSFIENYSIKPFVITSTGYEEISSYTIKDSIFQFLREEYNYEVLYKCSNFTKDKDLKKEKVILDLKNGIILEFIYDDISLGKNNESELTLNISVDTPACKNNIKRVITSWKLFYTPESSELYNEDTLRKVLNMIDDHKFSYSKSAASVGMVSMSNGKFHVKQYDIDENKVSLNFPEEHYGKGFIDFDKRLIEKLKTTTKGLVMLHGEPGTGKTYYIRHLLDKISKEDARVLYFPPTMVGSITDPSFMDFIGSWVKKSSKKVILLIEDAEPLLETRKNGRNLGITNLLNLTDGILNDCLGIQIIATFNTELKNIDGALQRTGRLIARKEFKKLSKKQAVKLCETLSINIEVKRPMTLSDIYSFSEENEILLHDIEDEKPIAFD